MKTIKLLLKTCLLFCGLGAFAQNLEIYVSDAGAFSAPDLPWQILKYDQNGQNPQVFIDQNQNLSWPQDIVFLESQNVVLISNLNTNTISRHDISTGNYISDFAMVSGGPTRMRIGPGNLLYVLQWSLTDNKVKRYQLDGTFVDEFTSVGVPRSIGMDWDSNGNLYVSSFNGKTVRKFDASGNDMGLFVDSELEGPTNVWFRPNGNLLVLDWSAGNVEEFDATGNHVGEFISGLGGPEGITSFPNGDILIGNGGNGIPGSVNMYNGSGVFIKDLIPLGSGGLEQPNAVVLRDPGLSTRQQNQEKLSISPNVGNRFHIDPKIFEHYGKLEVFSVSGMRVAEIRPGTLWWDASHLPEGVYFISPPSSRKKFAQPIIVKN